MNIQFNDAPLYGTSTDCPPGGAAHWLVKEGAPKIRVAHWICETPDKGTIFIAPGRTEYIEKYGRTVSDFLQLGFSVAVVDWRGQGLSDRLTSVQNVGHIEKFIDYQDDLQCFVYFAKLYELPKPWFLLGHSMGALVGLRWLKSSSDFSAAIFTSPLWGLNLPFLKKLASIPVLKMAKTLGLASSFAPGTDGSSYVLSNKFEVNRLTEDNDMYEYFIRQSTDLPHHQLGGPSIGWVLEAISECRRMNRSELSSAPILTFLGSKDEVISNSAVFRLDSKLKNHQLVTIDGARHDILSERKFIRSIVYEQIEQFTGKCN